MRAWRGRPLAKAGAWLGRRRCVEVLRRLHRDERGDMLEYAMVFAFVVVPTMFLFERLFEILSDYFSMIAFFVTWPFL